MIHLSDEILELVGSFVPTNMEEICAFVHALPDDIHGDFSAKMIKLPSLQVRTLEYSRKIPSLDIRNHEFTDKTYMDLTRNVDGSHSFFDAFGNHFTIFTWVAGSTGFRNVWCDLERKWISVNYYYYDLFVEGRQEDLPPNVSGRLFKRAYGTSIRFADRSELTLKRYTILLRDKSQQRKILRTHPSHYCELNAIRRVKDALRTLPLLQSSVSLFYDTGFLSGTMAEEPEWTAADKRLTRRPLIRHIHLTSSICITLRFAAMHFSLVHAA
jgi:hypothetical protein